MIFAFTVGNFLCKYDGHPLNMNGIAPSHNLGLFRAGIPIVAPCGCYSDSGGR